MARQPVATGATAPGRFLAVLAIVIVALGAWMGLTGHHKPKLGLDLQGGTSVTLIPQAASGQGQVTNALIDQAIDIIRQRVNGSGVAEAEITRQGSGSNATIVVSVPGKDQGDLLDKVNQTAQLTFRPVLATGAGVPTVPTPSATPSSSATSSTSPTGSPKASVKASKTASATPTASSSASAAGRQLTPPLTAASGSPSASPSASGSTAGSSASPSASPSGSASQGAAVDPAKLQASTAAALAPVYATIDCTNPANAQGFKDDPDKYLVTCDRDGQTKYLLAPAAVKGTEIKSAESGLLTQTNEWVVNLQFKSTGTKQFAKITTEMAKKATGDPTKQFAITLDGLVVSAPEVNDPDRGRQCTDQRQLHQGGDQGPGRRPQVRRTAAVLRDG